MKLRRSQSSNYLEITFSDAVNNAYLYQKEFGYIPKLLKRTKGKFISGVKNKRDSYIKRLEGEVDDSLLNNSDLYDKILESKRIHDFDIDKKLLRVAKNNNTRVLRTDKGFSPMFISSS